MFLSQDRQNQKARKVDAKSASRVAKVPLVDFKHESQRKSWLITKLGLPVVRHLFVVSFSSPSFS